jgi:hypothetical protein
MLGEGKENGPFGSFAPTTEESLKMHCRILQHFAIKLCNFTNFRMLF